MINYFFVNGLGLTEDSIFKIMHTSQIFRQHRVLKFDPCINTFNFLDLELASSVEISYRHFLCIVSVRSSVRPSGTQNYSKA